MNREERITKLYAGAWAVAVIVALSALGCGKKTLPVPPMPFNPPPVQHLSHVVSDGAVTLSFIFPETGNQKEFPVDGFLIDRAAIVRTETVCDTCPVRFRRVAEIRKGEGETYSFREPIETGYRYIYKVTPFSDQGKKGSSPATLQFDY